MKNIKYKLGDPIPNRIRLACYKKALVYYKRCLVKANKTKAPFDSVHFPELAGETNLYGICMILPVTL